MTTDSHAAEEQSKADRAESVERMLTGQDAPKQAEQPACRDAAAGSPPPDGVGESVTRRGEDIAEQDGKEPGRFDTGTDGTPADRPTGGSTPRDGTGVNPQDPITEPPPGGDRSGG